MPEEIRPGDKIEGLLEEYSPSELDSQVSRVCPYYEDEDRELTSAYGSIHRLVQSRLLVNLQLELDDMSVGGEIEGEEGGRIDGVVSKYNVSVNGKKIEIRTDEGEEVREVAVLEVKTGGLGPLQPSAYAYQWGLPVIVAEMKTGDVHLVDQQTATKFLSQAVAHFEDMEALREEGQRIPDYYQCRDCGNRDCEHHREGKRRAGNNAIKQKCEILDNIDEVTEKIVSTLRGILENEEQLSDVQNLERAVDGDNSENGEEG